jgi:hypothetical protein
LGCALCLLRLLPATSIVAEEVCSVSPDSVSIGRCGLLNDTTWSYYTARFSIPLAGGKCVYAWEVWGKAGNGNSFSWVMEWDLDASNLTQADEFLTPVDPNCTDSCEVIVRSSFDYANVPVSYTIQHRFNAYYVRDGEEAPPTDDDWPFRSLSDDERDELPSWSLTVTEDSCTYTKESTRPSTANDSTPPSLAPSVRSSSNGPGYTNESNSGRVRASGVLAAVICLIVVALQSAL